MTELAFHGGVDEIGGNKILVSDGDSRIFLDFGMSFARRGKYYEEYLNPRTANGIGDFLEMGLIPDISGVYRDDLMVQIGRQPQEPEVDAVFLSHAHADHANYVSFLNPEIPIHCGETCFSILDAIDRSSDRNIESEIVDFKPRPIVRGTEAIKRPFKTFRTGDEVKVGSISVKPVHVDHSVPGAYGFVIHTSDATLAYTGDLRLHGTHSEMTQEFVDAAAEAEPDVLITEGTRIGDANKSSEANVSKISDPEIKGCNNLVIADFNFKDVDRFRTFFNLAKENGRKFVLSFKEAMLLQNYAKDKKLGVPRLDDPNIVIFQPRKRTGQYADSDYPNKFEKELYTMANVWRFDQIKKHQSELIFFSNFWQIGHMIDIRPEKGSIFIHSLSEAFNEEMAISEERLNNWIGHLGLKKVHAHASGHASGPELKEVVRSIGAKTIFPIHTEKPEEFKEFSPVRVEEGKIYHVGNQG